jgi:hypothetical protein
LQTRSASHQVSWQRRRKSPKPTRARCTSNPSQPPRRAWSVRDSVRDFEGSQLRSWLSRSRWTLPARGTAATGRYPAAVLYEDRQVVVVPRGILGMRLIQRLGYAVRAAVALDEYSGHEATDLLAEHTSGNVECEMGAPVPTRSKPSWPPPDRIRTPRSPLHSCRTLAGIHCRSQAPWRSRAASAHSSAVRLLIAFGDVPHQRTRRN